ncbi:MAG: rubredoxin [Clostridia bacterium]|nr:rubredoxin [Clostridia bacterium]
MKYVCIICGYEYDEDLGDPENGIDPDTMWDDLPDDFECPVCGVSKDEFENDNY